MFLREKVFVRRYLYGSIFVLSKLGIFALGIKLPIKVSLKLHQELGDGVNPVV